VRLLLLVIEGKVAYQVLKTAAQEVDILAMVVVMEDKAATQQL
jgi:ethanolamine utilization protein EutP (predicted NTPase)